MKAGIWYDMEEKCPPRTGYYLAFKGMSMGDDEPAAGYYHWDARRAEWKDGSHSNSRSANVIYWTDADPAAWYENYRFRAMNEITEAEKDAWAEVHRAMERYELVKALTKV